MLYVTTKKRADDVIGSVDFRKFYDGIPNEDPKKKEFLATFNLLKEDCLVGNKIPRDLWPTYYIKKYGIRNLWRCPLRSGWRITYTIINQKDGFVVCILEALSHQEYEKRFGYRS